MRHLEATVADLIGIVAAERLKRARQTGLLSSWTASSPTFSGWS